MSGSWPRHYEFNSLNLRVFSANDSMERCMLSYCTQGPRRRVANDVGRWEGKSSQSGCSVRLDREKQASGAPPRVFRLICIITSAQLQRQSVERLVGVGSDERSEGNEMKIKNGREEGGASRMLPLSSPQTPLSALQASTSIESPSRSMLSYPPGDVFVERIQ